MHNLQAAFIRCPCCGEQIELLVDCSVGSQQYVEDCAVCCRPLIIAVETAPGEVLAMEARPEND